MIIHDSMIESSTGWKMKNKHKEITLFGDVKVGSEMEKGKPGKRDYMKFVGEGRSNLYGLSSLQACWRGR